MCAIHHETSKYRNTIACGLQHYTKHRNDVPHTFERFKPGCDYLTHTQVKPDKETRLEAGGT